MTDPAFNPADIGGLPTDAVVVEKRGTLMIERESYERVIEGLKMASDGAHHLTQSKQQDWDKIATVFDSLRQAAAKMGRMATQLQDAVASVTLHTSAHMGVHAAYDRVYRGLDMAAKGARQIATCHRGDLRWSSYAMKIEILRDKCSVLIRMKQQRSAILLPPGYH